MRRGLGRSEEVMVSLSTTRAAYEAFELHVKTTKASGDM